MVRATSPARRAPTGLSYLGTKIRWRGWCTKGVGSNGSRNAVGPPRRKRCRSCFSCPTPAAASMETGLSTSRSWSTCGPPGATWRSDRKWVSGQMTTRTCSECLIGNTSNEEAHGGRPPWAGSIALLLVLLFALEDADLGDLFVFVVGDDQGSLALVPEFVLGEHLVLQALFNLIAGLDLLGLLVLVAPNHLDLARD